MKSIRGKNLKFTVHDIAEGFTLVNPIFLKPLEEETIIELNREFKKMLGEIRRAKFPHKDTSAIRLRNMRLQRIHSASMVLKNYARAKKIILL